MNRFVPLAAILALTLGGTVALAQTTTPPTAPEIALQEVIVGGRLYVTDPYDLFNCFIVQRTIALPTTESDELDMTIRVQCFQRVGEQMVALDEVETRDFGVSTAAAVGQAIISEPQVAARELGND